jgi:hypothetical protein
LSNARGVHALQNTKTVKEAQNIARKMSIPLNFLFATDKDFGYQQSGHLPKRRGSGLAPLLGFKIQKKNSLICFNF